MIVNRFTMRSGFPSHATPVTTVSTNEMAVTTNRGIADRVFVLIELVGVVMRGLSDVDDGDRVDGEQKSSWQLDERCRSNRRRNREEFLEQRVECWKRVLVRHKTRHFDDASKAAARVFQDRSEIGKRLARLWLERIAGDFSG